MATRYVLILLALSLLLYVRATVKVSAVQQPASEGQCVALAFERVCGGIGLLDSSEAAPNEIALFADSCTMLVFCKGGPLLYACR